MMPFEARFAAVLLDRNGCLRQWDRVAQDLFGFSREQAAGHRISDVLLHGAHRDGFERALVEVAAGRCWCGIVPAVCGDGQVRDLMFCWEPLLGSAEDGAVMVSAIRTGESAEIDGQTAATLEHHALMNDVSTRIGATLDLAQTARDFMDVTVPRFADFAGLYILERLLADEPCPDRVPAGSVEARRLALGLALTDSDPRDWIEAFPADEIVVYRPASPFARCMSGGEPVLLTGAEMDAEDLGRIRAVIDDEDMRRVEASSMLAVPLKARGTLVGFVAFTRRPGRCGFNAHDVVMAERLATQAAICIDNARLYRRERRTVQALQDSLAPKAVTLPSGWQIAHRYLPAGRSAQVGGDWFDVIRLSDRRVAIVIGDAMGHDAVAAAAMGRMRTAIRALAGLDLPPAEMLQRLDRVTHDTDPDQYATCVYAICDLSDHSCRLARAGHVPPILFHPDGTTTLLDLPPGLPLGLGEGNFETISMTIPDCGVLVFYTDGLVESREHDLEVGITALRAALTDPAASPEAICDTITTALPQGHDDVTLLLVRMPPHA
jgi:GAF domain-containing protein